MGTYMYAVAQKKTSDTDYETLDVKIFDFQDYEVFAWLADVRNYSAITPLSKPRGIPEDIVQKVNSPTFKPVSILYSETHRSKQEVYVSELFEQYAESVSHHTWFTVQELLDVDYDQIVENRRCSIQTGPGSFNGGGTCEPGKGQFTSLKEYLGEAFMQDLDTLKQIGADRVLIGFVY